MAAGGDRYIRVLPDQWNRGEVSEASGCGPRFSFFICLYLYLCLFFHPSLSIYLSLPLPSSPGQAPSPSLPIRPPSVLPSLTHRSFLFPLLRKQQSESGTVLGGGLPVSGWSAALKCQCTDAGYHGCSRHVTFLTCGARSESGGGPATVTESGLGIFIRSPHPSRGRGLKAQGGQSHRGHEP